MNQLPPIGARVSELMQVLPSLLPEVASFTFTAYETGRSMLDELERLAKPQAARRGEERIGWLDIESKPFKEEKFEQVIDFVLQHRPTGHPFTFSAEDVASGRYDFADTDATTGSRVVAVTSICTLRNGARMHLPMLDFRCEPDDYFLHLLRVALSRMCHGGGAILRSGRSFHFYGFDLLDEAAWQQFMSRALLLSPLTDFRYVAHRLLDGFAVLRLTTSIEKPVTPSIAAYLPTGKA